MSAWLVVEANLKGSGVAEKYIEIIREVLTKKNY